MYIRTYKTLREITLIKKKPHIITEVLNKNFEIDKILSRLSKELFSIDKDSRTILSIIGKYGTLNESQIAKKSHNRFDRFVVRRRTIGIENKTNTLKERDYIIHTKGSKHQTGTVENNYTLTLKGLLAALNLQKFENFSMIDGFLIFISNKFNSNFDVSGIINELIKYHIALFLLWHKSNGLALTMQKNTHQYFLDWNKSNLILNLDRPTQFIRDPVLEEQLTNVRLRFFALENIVTFFLKKLKAHKTKFELDFDAVEELGTMNTSTTYYEIIKYWPYYLEQIQLEPFDLYIPSLFELDSIDAFDVDYYQEEVEKYNKKIFKKMNIKHSPKLSKQKPLWQH